jgi:hypothetical protein
MIAYRTFGATVAAFAVFALASAPASAAKKMTYEEAFAKCKQEINAGAPGSEALSTAQRSSAGGACMKKHGFRLKKGAM